MALDINKAKEVAEGAVKELSKNEQAQKTFDKVAEEIEKKTKIDIPDAKDIAKMIK